MENISIGQAQRLTSPAPFGLVSALMDNGETNLAAISWWTYLSNHPPTIGLCLSKKGLTGELIRNRKEFALSIVGETLAEAALKCGQCSGRTVDKTSTFGIPTENADKIGAAVVSGSRAVFECTLSNTVEVGDHALYIGEIVAMRGDAEIPQLFALNGYSRLGTAIVPAGGKLN